MLASLNEVKLIGTVGKEPEVRDYGDSSFARFSVVTDSSYKGPDGEKVDASEWHHVVCNGRAASQVSEFVHKGCLVYVSGKLKTRKYTDKTGFVRYITEVNAFSVLLLSTPEDRSKKRKAAAPVKQEEPEEPEPIGGWNDDLPY